MNNIRDQKRRQLHNELEIKRLELLSLCHNTTLSPMIRFRAQLTLAKLPRNSARVRIRNRCTLTGRPRAVYRQWHVSRIMIRELAAAKLIPGLHKASW
jgi:small subunit ribosomal protein S14|uniref:Ribosomal protein S14 n=1 Tax=Seculamonas ecuadoriensis TaxID=221724 RepID=M4QAW2_SECEC|nr:ribosomal protein S14 [Seculamonas ecuadoriensis]AGH24512.1 ribosomal protein S14 [Seculamonas ecuadoriensis]